MKNDIAIALLTTKHEKEELQKNIEKEDKGMSRQCQPGYGASLGFAIMKSLVGKVFRSVASLKVAIPLLVITVLVTIVGSLQPDTDYYRTWWYLGLLTLNGLSLLFITVLHIPSIYELIVRMKQGKYFLVMQQHQQHVVNSWTCHS